MALYRTVLMSFWTDSKVADDFTPEDRYFYLYLFTNPHTNLCGCYEISMKQVALETGYSRDTIESLIERFEKFHNVVRYSRETKEILLLNWHKYNWTTSEKFRKPLLNEISAIKHEGFREYLIKASEGNHEKYGINTVFSDEAYGIDTTNTNTSSNSNSSTSTKVKAKPPKHRYGEYNNVLLSDEDMEKLRAEFPDWQERIDRLSGYIKSKGVTYKDHLATIRNWARREKPKSRTDIVDAWV